MTELPTPDLKLRAAAIVDKFTAQMMEELDELHIEFSYPDEEIVAALRDGGYGHEADLYEDWIQDEDPPRQVNAPDPEGPGPGVVPDPPNESYAPLVAQLQAQREATTITYEWRERERMMYSCRATVNLSQLQTWLNAHWPHMAVHDLDPEVLIEFLEAEYSAVTNERRWPADHSETDAFDLQVVADYVAHAPDPEQERKAEAFQMLWDAKDVPPTVEP